MIALVIAGVFSFFAYFVLAGYAPILRDGDDGGTHALSKSAVGFGALALMLERLGVPMVTRRGYGTYGENLAASDLEDISAPLRIYTPPTLYALADLDLSLSFSPTLLVLPKWDVGGDPEKSGWVHRLSSRSARSFSFEVEGEETALKLGQVEGSTPLVVASPPMAGTKRGKTRGLNVPSLGLGLDSVQIEKFDLGNVDEMQFLLDDESLDPIIMHETGVMLVGRIKGTEIYLMAEPDLVNTQGLASRGRAVLAATMIDTLRAGEAVEFDLVQHGLARTRNIIRLVLEPPFLAMTICGFFAVFLLSVKSAARFGPPRRHVSAHVLGKSNLIENTAALIRLSEREANFTSRYATALRRRISSAVTMTGSESVETIDSRIDAIAAGKGLKDRFTKAVSDASNARTKSTSLKVAKRLFHIKKEIIS
jgi:hypothetical protein